MTMTDFENLGGVGILGYISPIDTRDTYPVTDPLYGIDGLRNVYSITDMLDISFERRRSGMIVGVEETSKYYKLKNIDWDGTINDWMELYLVGINDRIPDYYFVDKETPTGQVNGVNVTFELSRIPTLGSEHIYINGLLQESDYDYVIEDNVVVFYEAPDYGMRIRCSYRY